MSLRGTAYSGDTLVPFFFKPHPAGPAKGSKFVMCTCPHWENCIQQPHSFQDWHMGRLSGGGSKASRSGVRTVRRSVWRRGTAPWGGGRHLGLLGTHLVSVRGAKGSPFTAPSQIPSLQQSGQCVSSWPSDPAEFTAVGGFQT